MPESITDVLLSRTNVRAILKFAEEQVNWQHCCVFFPDFWQEVEAFWMVLGYSDGSGWCRIEPTWIALLYTLQGIAVHQMTNDDAEACGLTEGRVSVSGFRMSLISGSRSTRPSQRVDLSS